VESDASFSNVNGPESMALALSSFAKSFSIRSCLSRATVVLAALRRRGRGGVAEAFLGALPEVLLSRLVRGTCGEEEGVVGALCTTEAGVVGGV